MLLLFSSIENIQLKNVLCDSQYSQCWARDWLPQDCPNVRVLGVNYATTLSQWFPKCPKQNMRY